MVRIDPRFFGSARSFSDIVHLGSDGDSNLGLSSTSASVLELCDPSLSLMTKSSQQICFRGVRSSKFRHVYGCVGKREKCYEGLAITKNAHDSHFCAVNPKFLAVVTEVAGGGCFAVVPIHETGRVDLVVGRVTGHAGPVLDIKWNPFNDNVIASCSDDCTIKLWHIPDGGVKGRGGSATLDEWLVDLHGHTRRVGHIEWHPTADGVLVSAGFDKLLIIWNIAQGNAIRVLDLHPDSIYSLSFNRDGSRLATTCKDKKLRIFDPRTGKLIQEGRCHEGAKASKVAYLGHSGRLVTTGFSRYSDRQLALWEERDLSKPLRIEDIDSSSGVIFPIYDADTRILYLAGKGDGNIRYYEMVDADPWWFYLNQYLSGYPQRGLGIMPKRGVNPSVCEIMRFYKLHASRGLVEPISMIVPRKSDSSLFHEDLYPNTPGPTATVTAADWLDGKNAEPLLISLKSGWRMPTNKPVVYKPNEKQLITSDLNTERKFMFIAQETHPDYRSLDRQRVKRKLKWAQEQELVQGAGLSLSDLNAHNHLLPQDKQGVALSPGASRFHQIQKMWGEKMTGTPGAKKGDGVMSMSVDSIPMKEEEATLDAVPEMPAETRKECVEKRESKSELRAEIRDLKSQLTEKDAKIHNLESEVNDLKRQLTEIQIKLAAMGDHSDTGGHSDGDHPMDVA